MTQGKLKSALEVVDGEFWKSVKDLHAKASASISVPASINELEKNLEDRAEQLVNDIEAGRTTISEMALHVAHLECVNQWLLAGQNGAVSLASAHAKRMAKATEIHRSVRSAGGQKRRDQRRHQRLVTEPIATSLIEEALKYLKQHGDKVTVKSVQEMAFIISEEKPNLREHFEKITDIPIDLVRRVIRACASTEEG